MAGIAGIGMIAEALIRESSERRRIGEAVLKDEADHRTTAGLGPNGLYPKHTVLAHTEMRLYHVDFAAYL